MDRFSQLPDDILIHIMSFLPIKVAYKMGFLSKHWRSNCWLYVDALDFNTKTLIKSRDLKPHLRRSLDRPILTYIFFRVLNDVMRDCGLVEDFPVQLKKLRIQFPLKLDEEHLKQVDEWISYAFARKVQSLELDLLPFSDPRCLAYNEPRLLGFGTEIDLSCLRSLSLSGIQVNKQDIDSFLSKCPFLQHLKVCRSLELTRVEICGSSIALQHLEFNYCDVLKYVSVCGTSLVSLALTSIKELVLENNPKLVSVSISSWFQCQGPTLQMLSSSLSRLQILTLTLKYSHAEVFDQVPQLIELKQLTLVVPPLREDVSVRLTAILNLCPNLEKLILDLVVRKFEEKVQYKKGLKAPLQHLKDVEIHGYCGEEAEDELFIYVLEHIVAPIERIIFDPHNFMLDNINLSRVWKIKSVKRRAKQLKRMIPSSSINFSVL